MTTINDARTQWNDIDALADLTKDDGEANAHAVGVRDGYEQAVQMMDRLTGGDGELGDFDPVDTIGRIADRAQSECWKTEADTLRRIVMEALAEFDRDQPPFKILSAGHWANRAREALGIEEGAKS